jgi:hypothetical protein
MAVTVEDAKKDLQGMVDKQKTTLDKEREAIMTPEQKKGLEESRRKEQEERAAKEAQEKKDAELLAKKPDELSEEEKKNREKLEAEKSAAEEAKLPPEEKVAKRVKEESQKRIDEIINEMKQKDDKTAKQMAVLESELARLKEDNAKLSQSIKPSPESGPENVIEKKETERIVKYTDEDKSKPREQRREMSDDELQEFLLDDVVGAQRWIARQEARRERERVADERSISVEKKTTEFQRKVAESNKRVLIRHPELDTEKRETELKAQGKNPKEIFETLCKENESYRIAFEIVKATPDVLRREDGPELVEKELERRLKGGAEGDEEPDADQKAIDDLKSENESLKARIQALEDGDVGITSTVTRRKNSTNDKLTPQEELLVDTMRKNKAPQENIDSALKKMRAKQAK